jgi:protocatechuate 3,4-dioxygenase, beta subunit
MSKYSKVLTRRKFVTSAAGTAGLVGLAGVPLTSQSAEKKPDEISDVIYNAEDIPFIGMTEDGPLYPPVEIPWQSDLTSVSSDGQQAKGKTLFLFGRILSREGRPLKDATVEIWHTDINGNYKHPRGWGQDDLDPNFGYFGKVKTNEEGYYFFKTIRPRWYYLSGLPGSDHKGIPRAAQIHIKMRHVEHGVLTTEAYFDNTSHEEVAPKDLVFLSRPKRVRDRILLNENSTKDYSDLAFEFEEDAICCRYDMAFLL